MDYTLFDQKRAESEARIKVVSELKQGAHVHFSAICGTGMGSVAGLLKQQGFYITGSDKSFYPPMGDVVRNITDELYEGYSAENLSKRPDLVVIGNNLSKDNPEVKAVQSQGIPFASMPEVFGAILIGSRSYCRYSVVVSGTHGKTTTAAAVASILDSAGRKPGYFVGGVPLNLPGGVRPPDFKRPPAERIVVLEGDEYDSAYFAKWPKFLSYRPDILIITSIEFDHADIYENVSEIEREFSRLVSLVPSDGLILVANIGESLKRLIPQWKRSTSATILTYGSEIDNDLQILSRQPSRAGQEIGLKLLNSNITVSANLGGAQNASNILAATAVGEFLGLSPQELQTGVSSFKGVLRRQTVHEKLPSGANFIEDFAHHPTAVKLTLDGIKEQYPDKRIVAVYEPRSNTSMRSFFQEDYIHAFRGADLILFLSTGDRAVYSNTSSTIGKLDIFKLSEDLKGLGKEALVFDSAVLIGDWILNNSKENEVVICMSNGDFGGLIQRLNESTAKSTG